MKTFKFSRVHSTRENTDVFITLDDNIYGIHSKRVNIYGSNMDACLPWMIRTCFWVLGNSSNSSRKQKILGF